MIDVKKMNFAIPKITNDYKANPIISFEPNPRSIELIYKECRVK